MSRNTIEIMKTVGSLALSKVYGLVTRLRNWLYDRELLTAHKVPIPIVCIGNLGIGGNAKTPLCLFLVTQLKKRGYKPVILSRGYGGTLKGPHIITPTDDSKEVGDEPLMLHRLSGVPIVIGGNRVMAANFIVANKLGDLIVLDDGFQHRRLKRNVDIVSVNITSREDIEEFLSNNILPYGKLREDRDQALIRADMIIFAERLVGKPIQELPVELIKILPKHLQVYKAHLISNGVKSLDKKHELKPRREVLAFCAIANPQGFFKSLEQLGYKIREKFSYPDHYQFSEKDLERMTALHPELPLICTEKDAVKLDSSQADRIYTLITELVVEPTDAFIVQILKNLNK